ncbi:MAG: hypothetical protein Q9218_005976 [Villophora microphyllina]
MSHVYELYYKAFENLRRFREIKSETYIKQRISRRVIAEQHLALTETFHSPWHFPDAKQHYDPNADFIGEVFLRCNAKEVVEECSQRAKSLAKEAFGSGCQLPEVKLEGHLDATFPYILSHLQYIVGELLRNSMQAVVEKWERIPGSPAPVEVLICEAPQHVIIRISDQGGGIPKDILPSLWSFGKGPRSRIHLENLERVPKMAATMQEIKPSKTSISGSLQDVGGDKRPMDDSLSSLTSRPPNLRLGMGLPMSRVYAEYWAGSLEVHSLEGYGVDAFLQISKLGNKNEQLSTRANFYIPAIRDFSKEDPFPSGGQLHSIHHPQIFEPIDTVTVWKGLALSDCENLLLIQKVFKDCVEDLLEHQVAAFRDRCLQQWQQDVNGSYTGANCMDASVSRRFRFERPHLIAAASEALDPSVGVARSASGKTMRELLMLYLRSRDSLFHLSDESSGLSAIDLRLKLSANHAGCSAPLSTIEVTWIPEYLFFEKLDLQPQEGSNIIIKPHYRTNAPQSPGGPHTQVTYTLASNHPWLRWDAKTEAFRGPLPYFSKSPSLRQTCRVEDQGYGTTVYLLEIDVKAFVVVAYPSSRIRLERTIRTRLTLRVMPSLPVSSPLLFPIDLYEIRGESRIPTVSKALLPCQAQGPASEDPFNSAYYGVTVEPEPLEANRASQFMRVADIGKNSCESNIPATSKAVTTKDVSVAQDASQVLNAERKPEQPKSHTLPFRRLKRTASKSLDFSNIPGINLQTLAIMEKSASRYPIKPATSNASSDDARSETSSDRENRIDNEAGELDMLHRLHNPRIRHGTSHGFVATLPFRPRQLTVQSPTDPLPQTPCTKPSVEPSSALEPPSKQSPVGLNLNNDIEKTVTKRKKKKSSKQRRRDRVSKTSPLKAESMLIRNQDCHDGPAHSKPTAAEGKLQQHPETPTKCGRKFNPSLLSAEEELTVNLNVDEVNRSVGIDQNPLFVGKVTGPSQAITFSNRFAPLASLKSDDEYEWMSSESYLDLFNARSNSEASSSARAPVVARNGRARAKPARGSDRSSEDTGGSSTSYIQSSESSCPTLYSRTTSVEPDPEGYMFDKSAFFYPPPSPPLTLVGQPVEDDRVPVYVSLRSRLRRPLRTPSPHGQDDDEHALRERAVVSKLLSSSDARQAFMQPDLSSEERGHIFEAMKRSLFDGQGGGMQVVAEEDAYAFEGLLSSEDMGSSSEYSLDSF